MADASRHGQGVHHTEARPIVGTLYRLSYPANPDCAEAIANNLDYHFCDTCNRLVGFPKPEKREIEWAEGSDRVCPFVWDLPAGAEVVVTEEVRQALAGLGAEFLPVTFYQDPKARRPQRITKRTKRRVWLPYEGPALYLLWASTMVHADLERSSFTLISECPACGEKWYGLEGYERWESKADPERHGPVKVHIPREPGKGIYVHERDLGGAEIFRVYEMPGMLLCTDKLKQLIDAHHFGNVLVLEVGNVLGGERQLPVGSS